MDTTRRLARIAFRDRQANLGCAQASLTAQANLFFSLRKATSSEASHRMPRSRRVSSTRATRVDFPVPGRPTNVTRNPAKDTLLRRLSPAVTLAVDQIG